MLVGPFADFTDLQLARRQVEVWTNGTTGWVRNRHWPAAVSQKKESQDEKKSANVPSTFTTSGPFYPREMPQPAAKLVVEATVFSSSGPFYGDPPATRESPMLVAHGPFFPHLSDGPFYIHLGAFTTEEAREEVSRKMANLRMQDMQRGDVLESPSVRRDTLQTADGRLLHRLLFGPFGSYEKGLHAKRAIQKATGIQTGWVDNPRWEEHQHCPNENLVRRLTPEPDDLMWHTSDE
jgi:hypothetical protein